jgi:SAM-dependent methyltransferase
MSHGSAELSNSSLPFGAAADTYDRLRFLPSDDVLSWLLKGTERRVLDLAAGTGQVTSQLVARGLSVVAVEPDRRMRDVFATRFPQAECLDGTAERIPLASDSLDAVIVGSAWHWFDAPAALAEIARVLHDHGRLGVFATSANTSVDWVRDMYMEGSLRSQQRGDDSHRNVELPSADFSRVTETSIESSRVMAADDVVAWFRTHSNYVEADAEMKSAIEDRAAQVLRERFPGERNIEVPVITPCWRAERLRR